MIGKTNYPDLNLSLIIASEQVETGAEPELIYEKCGRLQPIVEPDDQRWFCRFGFSAERSVKDCAVVVSIQADDHAGMWKPELGSPDPVTGLARDKLFCRSRGTKQAIRSS